MKKIFFVVIILVVGLVLFDKFLLKKSWIDDEKRTLNKFAASYCEWRGGVKLTKGCGIANCSYGCVFSYASGGEGCQTSDDCGGKCVVTSPKMTYSIESKTFPLEMLKCRAGENGLYDCSDQNFKAECLRQPLGNCEEAWEYSKGIVKKISSGFCSM